MKRVLGLLLAGAAGLSLAAMLLLPASADGFGPTISLGTVSGTTVPVNAGAPTDPYIGFNLHIRATASAGVTITSIASNNTGSIIHDGGDSGNTFCTGSNPVPNVERVYACTSLTGFAPTTGGLLANFVINATGNGCVRVVLVEAEGDSTLDTYTVDQATTTPQSNVVSGTAVNVFIGTGVIGDCPGGATATPTNTPIVATNTPTRTSTSTNTPIPPTNTPTRTNTPTNTPIPPTNTPTNTPVNTNTPTNTPVNTNTPTNTPVNTSTPTNTPVNTNTPTNTPVNTSTPTNTPVNTNTPTNTPVNTNTPTNTPIPPTNTPTNTPVNTNTPTNTPVNTSTPTNTAVNTSTPTNTPVNTSTPTNTPANTNTPTSTNTPVNTATNTPTRTSTSTPTRTNTPVNTNTPTSTSTPGGQPCADFNRNGVVDVMDIVAVAKRLWSHNPNYDLDGDKRVTVMDLLITIRQFQNQVHCTR